MGTSDTVYLQMLAPSGNHASIALIGGTASSKDFDLYVRCNALPTPTNYLDRSFSGDSNELIHLDSNACSGTLYIAVNSWRGSGQFKIEASWHKPSRHIANLRAGINFSALPATVSTISDTLTKAARRLYGATEGSLYIENIDLYNGDTSTNCGNCGGQNCHICFKPGPFRSNATICSGPISGKMFIDVDGCDYTCVTHEFGHYVGCLPDEYNDFEDADHNISGRVTCGHTLMGAHWLQTNMCTEQNHKKDPDLAAGSPTPSSGWHNVFTQGLTPYEMTWSPPVYDYVGHDMQNLVGRVLTHY